MKNGVYYLNLRLYSQKFFRKSLKVTNKQQAELIIAKITPFIIALKNTGGGGVADAPTKSTIAALIEVLNIEIRTHADILMQPLSSKALEGKYEYEHLLEWSYERLVDEGMDEKEAEYAARYCGAPDEFEHSREVLSGETGYFDEERCLNLIGINSDHELFPNGKQAIQFVRHHLKKLYKEISDYDYDKAKKTLDKLQEYSLELKQDNPSFDGEGSPPNVELVSVNSAPKKDNLLLDLIPKFIEYKCSGTKPWSEKILKDNTNYLDAIGEVIGNMSVEDIDGATLDEAFTTLQDLPKSNILPYKHMTVAERVAIARDGMTEEGKAISPKTLTGYKKLLQSFFKFLKLKRILKLSPTEDMQLEISVDSTRGAFDDEQRQKIIDYCLKQSDVIPYKKWAVLIMAYSGMRNTEIIQLSKDCVKTKNGINYLMINELEERQVKTKAGIRQVPLHRDLINWGFLDFVKNSKTKELFPENNSKTLTKYYQIIKKELSLPNTNEFGEEIVLYSLRHWVTSYLRDQDIDIAKIQQLIGHKKAGSGITDRYTKQSTLGSLNKVVNRIPSIYENS